MIYDLALPREKFDRMTRTVRAVLANSRMDTTTELRLITTDSTLLSDENQGYLEENPGVLGVCFGQDDANQQFDIWLSPAYRETDTDFYKDTVLHELCHGYFKMYPHNHRWKRVFGRVLHHYNALVEPLDTDDLAPTMLKRYTRQGANESDGQFFERVDNEHNSIAKAAMAEFSHISRTYDRMEALSGRSSRLARVG